MYIIEPIATTEDKTMNIFLYNTYKGGYNETSDTPVSDCYFKKLVIQGDSLQEEHLVSDTKYLFEVTYQGSSTLKYGVKNFEIGAKPHTD
jgi:hypothetical protein